MLIKGEKYACDACVRGHRVSWCTHSDRPLIHINRKGRPVSQCPHCRGLRKARAQHVKCDCAEKPHTKEECPHEKNEGAKGEHVSCCCAHGAKCTCALKKEHSLDPVPEDLLPNLTGARVTKQRSKPPRLNSSSSMESKMKMFMNAHHKPVHKIKDIHNRLGTPYKVPARSHTIHGPQEFAQRSTESLFLPNDLLNGISSPPTHCSVTSAPHPARRQVKSEHGSPTMNTLPMPPESHIPPISIPPYDPNSYSYSPFSGGSPAVSSAGSNPWEGGFPEQFPDNYYVTYGTANEMEYPSSGALGSDTTEVDWSTYNLPNGLGNGAAGYGLANGGTVPSQPPSYASFDRFSHLSHPGIASSSGEISEVEDFVPVAEPSSLQNSSQDALNDFSSVGAEESTEQETFRLSSASSYAGMSQASMLTSENLDSLDIDEYLKNTEARSREMALRNQEMQHRAQRQLHPSQVRSNVLNAFTQSPEPLQHALSVQEAQNYAHTTNQSETAGLGNLPVTNSTLRSDPMMPSSLTEINSMTEADERDDGWVR